MTRPLALEDFSDGFPEPDLANARIWPDGPQPPEEDALEAFDSAYKSGWADCAAAETEERRGISADLAKNLADAKLTYETARRDVLAALGPFFEDVVSTLLPRMAAAAVLPCVLAEIDELAAGSTQTAIELHAAPSTCPALERLAETEGIEGLVVHPEPAFAEGQVSLRRGSERRDIDMSGAADRIAAAIVGFQAQSSLADPAATALSQGAA